MNLHNISTPPPPPYTQSSDDDDDDICQWCLGNRSECYCCSSCGSHVWRNTFYISASRRVIVNGTNRNVDASDFEEIQTEDQEGWECDNCRNPPLDDLCQRIANLY